MPLPTFFDTIRSKYPEAYGELSDERITRKLYRNQKLSEDGLSFSDYSGNLGYEPLSRPFMEWRSKEFPSLDSLSDDDFVERMSTNDDAINPQSVVDRMKQLGYIEGKPYLQRSGFDQQFLDPQRIPHYGSGPVREPLAEVFLGDHYVMKGLDRDLSNENYLKALEIGWTTFKTLRSSSSSTTISSCRAASSLRCRSSSTIRSGPKTLKMRQNTLPKPLMRRDRSCSALSRSAPSSLERRKAL